MPQPVDVDALIAGIASGERSAVARAITVVESKHPLHRAAASELLHRIPAPETPSIRLGISGVPGAGKSTFTDALGIHLIERGSKVAVLAVDPSSSKTGGSILGDRTRMAALAVHDSAFIRPSPSGCHLGGVARATREAMLIVEAAGYDVVIVETVGVGQSEVAVAGMVDTFLLLALTRAGDQLQGIKRGILEIADVIAVNKADGDNLTQARMTARELSIAMRLMAADPTERKVPVLTCSALEKTGLDDVWDAILEHRAWVDSSFGLEHRRGVQQGDWMWAQITSTIDDALHFDPALAGLGKDLEHSVVTGAVSALDAAQVFLEHFGHRACDLLG